MEEVAEGSKELVKKLSEDEKLITTLQSVTEDFHSHANTHTRATQVVKNSPPQPTMHFARPKEEESDDSTELQMECKHAVEQSRFRAYNFTRKLKQRKEELETGIYME